MTDPFKPKKRDLTPFERRMEPVLVPLRKALYLEVRQSVWSALPPKAVKVEQGPRAKQVFIGDLVFRIDTRGGLKVSKAPNIKIAKSTATLQELASKLDSSFLDFVADVAHALHVRTRFTTDHAMAQNNTIARYSEALETCFDEHSHGLIDGILEELRRVLEANPKRCIITHLSKHLSSLVTDDVYDHAWGETLRKCHIPSPCPPQFLETRMRGILDGILRTNFVHIMAWRFKYYIEERMKTGVLGLPGTHVARHGLKVLTQEVNREVWDLCWRSAPKGREISPKRMRHIVQFRPFYEQVRLDCPSMLKLFAMTFERFMSPQEKVALVQAGPQAAMSHTKLYWHSKGMAPLGWKLLHRLDPFQREACFRKLEWLLEECKKYQQPEHDACLAWAALVSDVATSTQKMPSRLWSSIHGPWALFRPQGWHREIRKIYLRGLAQAATAATAYRNTQRRKATTAEEKERAKQGGPLVEFKADWNLVQDYFNAVAEGNRFRRNRNAMNEPPTIPKGASWAWLKNRSAIWHHEIYRDPRYRDPEFLAQAEKTVWPGSPEVSDGVNIAIPLTNHRAMIEEGNSMHHCVGDYVDYCLSCVSRIFSIRDQNRKRVATLEFRRSREGGWHIAQIRGHVNKDLSAVFADFAAKVLAESLPYFLKQAPVRKSKKTKHQGAA